ncbi:Type II secretion system protein G precursor [compost metagenome]
MQRQKGFTLIELVVVIVILGVLAAVALPRFMNATDDAHTSAVQGTGGALAAGVALVRSQWELNRVKGGATPNLNVAGFGANNVDVNGSGWPLGTTDANTSAECVEVWNSVLQGSAPRVAAAAATGIDYVATGTGTATCTYTYQLDGRAAASATPLRTIVYSTVTGAVTTTAD